MREIVVDTETTGLDPQAGIEHTAGGLIEGTLAGRPVAAWDDAADLAPPDLVHKTLARVAEHRCRPLSLWLAEIKNVLERSNV